MSYRHGRDRDPGDELSSRLKALGVLERGAGSLRSLGLGSLVDAVGRRIAPTIGTFDVQVDGLRLHGDHIGQLYYVRELIELDRERTFVELLRAATPRGGAVLEAGAHIGYVTLQAARAVGPEGRVVTFEPNPRTVPLIRRNLEANGLGDRVTVIECALGEHVGRLALHISGGGDTSSLHGSADATESVDVEVTTADARVDPSLRVDVVKLDVEGAEVAALRGMSDTLRRAAPGLTLFVECNPPMLEQAGTSVAELIDVLRANQLDVLWIDEERGTVRPFDEVDWSHGYVNLYCPRRSAS